MAQSPAFKAYSEIRDAVKAATPHIPATGKDVITVSSLKSGKDGDQIFYLNSKSNEAVQITLSKWGNMKSAAYIDKDADPGEKRTFVAKDFEKLTELVKDSALAKAASAINWEKVAAKDEVDAPEEEHDDPEI